MSIILTIIAVIVIFSILILIHEYGHFIAARKAGIKVLEFGIGFPPRLFGKKIGETIYSVNAIPFGGFVRLFGEDATSEAIIKNKRSFAHKTPWVRTKVTLAGVAMNFLLAILLLTIGFSFGIEPLLVTEDDLFIHIANGTVKTAPGAYISRINDSAKSFGLQRGDNIIAINDKPVTSASHLAIFQKGKAEKDVDLTIREPNNGAVQRFHIPLTGKDNYFGIDLKPLTEFPRLVISEVKANSNTAIAGLRSGDVILRLNGEEIYFLGDFENALTAATEVTFGVLRGTDVRDFTVKLPDTKRVVIAEVFENSAAEKFGFEQGDIVLLIEGEKVGTPEQVQDILRKNPGKEMIYRLYRRGVGEIELRAAPGENNLLGIALSLVSSFRNTEISVYRSSVLTSITEIGKVRYGPFKALKQAVSESVRLTGLTIRAFGRTIVSIISKFTVPAEIGGPVSIAYYTHTFVKEGFFALLRFTALISLSLGVLNILPIPALDGGRFLFILIEVVFKKRVNAKFEALIHSIGFVLLLILIFLVTYSDIVKLF